MTAAMLTIDDMLSRLHGVKPAGPGKWIALCPAHDDVNPSLSVSEGENGRVGGELCGGTANFVEVPSGIGCRRCGSGPLAYERRDPLRVFCLHCGVEMQS